MADKANILRRSKRVETEFVHYFWPDRKPDEQGSVRDWKQLWDCSGLGFDGEIIVIEAKSGKWRPGPKSLWSLLQAAYEQLLSAFDHELLCRIHGIDPNVPGVVTIPLVGYKPLNSRIQDAICYFDFHGQMVAMPAYKFKALFVEKRMCG